MTTISCFLLLLKSVYPDEYMDDSGKINESSLPEKEDFYGTDFYSHIKGITDAD